MNSKRIRCDDQKNCLKNIFNQKFAFLNFYKIYFFLSCNMKKMFKTKMGKIFKDVEINKLTYGCNIT
jgi:hypothetical protein